MPPRRKKKKTLYVWGDTPEIEALGAGFARQGYFNQGYGEARLFGNELAMKATAVPADQKAQIAFLAGRYGDHGKPAGPFLQPVTGVNLQKELGLSCHYLDRAFEKNITKHDNGLQHSSIHGLDVLRAYKLPQTPPPTTAVKAALALRPQAPPTAAAALVAHQTRSVTHQALREERAAISFARMARSPTYQVRTAAKFTEADMDDFLSQKILVI